MLIKFEGIIAIVVGIYGVINSKKSTEATLALKKRLRLHPNPIFVRFGFIITGLVFIFFGLWLVLFR